MTFLDIYQKLFGEIRPPVSDGEIPCRETSDSEKLCRNPLVSVRMAAYNHEKWIAQAIESVLMQQTDFEYELVIGEDCSQDRTREICLEYQKKYPDKIRVLWSETNVNNIGAGNTGRITARCRGEWLATCEGDDYWTSPHKLQRQVDLAREKHVDVCVAFHQTSYPDGRLVDEIYPIPTDGLIGYQDIEKHYFQTTTYLVRRSLWNSVLAGHPDIMDWYDTILFPCFAVRGHFAVLPEMVSVYRRTGRGIMTSLSLQNTWLFGVRQSLMRLIWFPELPRREAIDVALSRVLHLLCEKDVQNRKVLKCLFWKLVLRSFPCPRSLYALVRYLV